MTSSIQSMRNLLAEDRRFKFEAYQFIREALQYAHENIAEQPRINPKTGRPEPRHVTGQQLCEACRLYAIDQFGYLAKMVLASWGIRSTSDFGELVYNLIRIEQMRKSDTDRREDFDDVYSFEDAFEPEFQFITSDDD
jgi:uncharacterized repeat protein (TIGR04138 family)